MKCVATRCGACSQSLLLPLISSFLPLPHPPPKAVLEIWCCMGTPVKSRRRPRSWCSECMAVGRVEREAPRLSVCVHNGRPASHSRPAAVGRIPVSQPATVGRVRLRPLGRPSRPATGAASCPLRPSRSSVPPCPANVWRAWRLLERRCLGILPPLLPCVCSGSKLANVST